jgi:hypothetical protein
MAYYSGVRPARQVQFQGEAQVDVHRLVIGSRIREDNDASLSYPNLSCKSRINYTLAGRGRQTRRRWSERVGERKTRRNSAGADWFLAPELSMWWMTTDVSSPESDSARSAFITTACRSSTLREICPRLDPGERRQTSRPASTSNANRNPPDAPNTHSANTH